MYIIFFVNRFIVLTDNLEKSKIIFGDCRVVHFEGKRQLHSLIDVFKNDSEEKLMLVHSDLEEMRSSFFNYFKIIKAAGGYVLNPDKQVLFIKRNGVNDLPKGKIEKGEQPKQAAQREVSEECGVSGMKITDESFITYHTFEQNEKWILKITYWFKMYYNKNETPVPQTEEDITDVFWVKEDFADFRNMDTYSSIKEVLCYFASPLSAS